MDFSRLKILMVEDDPLNRTLANHLFKKLGCTYKLTDTDTILTGGDKFTGYDLILVDIETREGYTVLEKIRSEDATVSLIGMTIDPNNALLSKCLEAGMNDYILKPLKLDELSDKINSDIKNTDSSNLQTREAIFDFDRFYVTCGGNKATVKNIISLYLAHTTENMKQMTTYVNDCDWKQLKGLSHRIKVVYALMGLPEVKNYFDEIEEDINNNTIDINKFRSHLAAITDRSMQLMHELNEINI